MCCQDQQHRVIRLRLEMCKKMHFSDLRNVNFTSCVVRINSTELLDLSSLIVIKYEKKKKNAIFEFSARKTECFVAIINQSPQSPPPTHNPFVI